LKAEGEESNEAGDKREYDKKTEKTLSNFG